MWCVVLRPAFGCIVCILLCIEYAAASFCGIGTIPYSLEVLSNGETVLGCAQPKCFGYLPSGQPVENKARFALTRGGKLDGFVREEKLVDIDPFGEEDVRFHTPQTANCEKLFLSRSCDAGKQWVGGIKPRNSTKRFPFRLRCCTYFLLSDSVDKGIAMVRKGEIVQGGEVYEKNELAYFDYIANVQQESGGNGSIYYSVSVRRMQCPDYSSSAKPELARQAPIETVDTPIELDGVDSSGAAGTSVIEEVQSTNESEIGVLEEIFVDDAVQLVPGAQPNGPVPPAPLPQQGAVLPFQQPPVFEQPVAQPFYNYYNYYPVGAAGGGDMMCFSGDQLVETPDGSTKRMDELQRNDWVQTVENGQLMFRIVSRWIHRDPDANATFYKIETSDGRAIKLTALHYIYKAECAFYGEFYIEPEDVVNKLVFAQNIEEGDCLYTESEEYGLLKVVKVVKVTTTHETGIYSPMTENGAIVVNGVFASCYNIIDSDFLHQSFFLFAEDLKYYFSWLFSDEEEQRVIHTPPALSMLIEMMTDIVPINNLL